MAFFFAGFVLFGLLEWRSTEPSAMGWFLVTSLWSAVSGIGFTVGNWWVVHRRPGSLDDPRDDADLEP